jgi:hypothetical protein
MSTKAEGHDEVRPIDLGPLDPTTTSRFDAAVDDILDAARFELRRRAAASRIVTDSFAAVPRLWGRVAWPAAAAIALTSLALLTAGDPSLRLTPDEATAIAVGVPEALAPWIDEAEAPGLGSILVGWEGEPE